MKVLIDNNYAFSFAHGGIQQFIERLIEFLPEHGVCVEPLRWWDETQKGDIVHYFYRPTEEYLKIVKPKSKIVMNVLLGPLTSMSSVELMLRRILYSSLRKGFKGIANSLSLNYPQYADAVIYHSNYESRLGEQLFKADPQKSHIILPGVSNEYYMYSGKRNSHRNEYLVTLSTIYEVKNSLLTARIAKAAKVPVVFLGRPYNIDSAYYRQFINEVDNKYVIYKGDPSKETKAEIMFNAKGFLLLSRYESAPNVIGEASACGCPLILSDLMWARSNYSGYAKFINISNEAIAATELRKSYDQLSYNEAIFPVKNWKEVTEQIANIYASIL